jgi:iron complex transport system permease protein
VSAARRLLLALIALSAALLAVAVIALLVGSAQLSAGAVLAALTGRDSADSVATVVTLSLRLPRIAVAALAGGALAVAGVAFQALTRNPLAEPSVLGVSAGAAFGVVLAQIYGLGFTLLAALGLAAFAFAGALVAAGAVYLIAAAGSGLSIQTLLLAGVIVGIFFSSAITVLISIVDFNRLGGVIHWLLGNLGPIPPAALLVFGVLAALGFWLILGQARALNVLALGEEAAAQLGVNAERLKVRIFAGAALLTACAVAFAGPIGFVGLIVPHLLRGALGQDNRLLVPAALVGGATFLLLADTLARNVIAPAELSVGVITSLCGAPFFVYLLRTRYRARL